MSDGRYYCPVRTCDADEKDGSRQASQASRLGSAAVTAHVNADGSGYVTVARDGKTIHHFAFGPEGDALAKAKADNGD